MKTLLLFVVLLSTQAFAQNQALQPGQSIQVACGEGATNSSESVGSIYARLPYAHKVRILRVLGIGTCSVRTYSKTFDFFISPRYPNGVYFNSSNEAIIDAALRSGECD